MIDVVPAGDAGGQIGMTVQPGRSDWGRELELDLDRILAWHPDLFITLVEPHEFEQLGVAGFPNAVARRGLHWKHLAIRDAGVPTPEFEHEWERVLPEALDLLRKGGRVLLHCRGGLGRTGMIAACLLVELGVSADDAIDAVRRSRSPRAIETIEQERYVRKCARAKVRDDMQEMFTDQMGNVDIDAMVAHGLRSGAYDRYLYYESSDPLMCPNGHVAITAGTRRLVYDVSGTLFKNATFDDTFCVFCPECKTLFNLPPCWDDAGPIHAQSDPPPGCDVRQIFYWRSDLG